MGIMTFPDKIKAALLHEQNVPSKARVGLRNAPAGTIVVRIHAIDQIVRSIQYEALIRGPLNGPNAQRTFVIVHDSAFIV